MRRCYSTTERLEKSLGLLDIWDDFAPHVFSAEMVAAPKPAPDLILHRLKAFDAAAERSVLVDDSPQGIRPACAAGVCGIGFVASNDPRQTDVNCCSKLEQ